MAFNVGTLLSILGSNMTPWNPFKAAKKLPEYAGYAYGLLTDPEGVGRALSDKYLGTHFGESDMMQEQDAINDKNAEDERLWQEKMLAEDRAYNSAANQMQLLRAAGLNPGLMYGQMGDMSGTAPNAGAASVGLSSPQYGAVPEHALLAAQVDNLNADTAKKKEETKEKEISNEVGRMNANAFKSAYEEGLVHDAIKAGFSKDIDDAGISRYSLMESSWNFAILTGCSLEQSFKTGGLETFGWSTENGLQTMPKVFDYDSKAFERANQLYIGSENAQIKVNDAAKKAAELQIESDKKGFDIYKALNDAANRGETWAKIARVGLWIAEQKFSMPLFNFNISNHRNSNKSKK